MKILEKNWTQTAWAAFLLHDSFEIHQAIFIATLQILLESNAYLPYCMLQKYLFRRVFYDLFFEI